MKFLETNFWNASFHFSNDESNAENNSANFSKSPTIADTPPDKLIY